MKAGMAMEKASAGEGAAGSGVGLGVGMLIPGLLAGAIHQPQANQTPKLTCPECHQVVPPDARFCPYCGHQLVIINKCPNCGKNLPPNAQFCPRCGTKIEPTTRMITCPHCGAENLPQAIYCNACGEKLK